MRQKIGFMPNVFLFSAVDIAIYCSIYCMHALFIKDFPISEALIKSVYELLWRLVSFQLIIQILFMSLLYRTKFGGKILFILAIAIVAYSLSVLISFSDPKSILKLLNPFVWYNLGEGFAISISVCGSWMVFRLLGYYKIDD